MCYCLPDFGKSKKGKNSFGNTEEIQVFWVSVNVASDVSDAIIESIEEIEVSEMINANADFFDDMANQKIDLYSGKEYSCRNIRSNTSFAPWCSFCLWMTRKSETASSRRNPMKKQMPEEPGGTFGGYISGINSEYNNMVGLPIAVSDMKAED